MSKKATLAEIIAKKKQGKMDKFQVKHYDSAVLGMKVEIRKIPLEQYLILVEGVEENTVESMNKLIYECCPMFHDKEYIKEAMELYGVSVPTDLPSKVFEEQLDELKAIVEIINSFYGVDKLSDTVKNS